jgi:hypothetical protein
VSVFVEYVIVHVIYRVCFDPWLTVPYDYHGHCFNLNRSVHIANRGPVKDVAKTIRESKILKLNVVNRK